MDSKKNNLDDFSSFKNNQSNPYRQSQFTNRRRNYYKKSYSSYESSRVNNRQLLRRTIARFIDIGIIVLLHYLAGDQELDNFFLILLLYNFVFCIFNGRTIGRAFCGISYRCSGKKHFIFRSLLKELLFWIFLWAIFFELIFSEKPFVHERFSSVFFKLAAVNSR